MAKMKYFGKAMAVVRKAPRKENGKLKNGLLAMNVVKMLERVRAKDFDKADEHAKVIVTTPGLHN